VNDEQVPETEQLRADIADTREDLSQTVSALADKADVKARAAEGARQATAEVQERAQEAVESVRQRPGRWAAVGAAAVGIAVVTVLVRRRRSR